MCMMSKSTTSELMLQLDAILGNTKLGTDENWDRNVTGQKQRQLVPGPGALGYFFFSFSFFSRFLLFYITRHVL